MRLRRLPPVLLVAAAATAFGAAAPAGPALGGAPASAADGRAEARAQCEQARVLVDRAVELTRAGRRDEAYDAAREAYLDHFERAEVPLRLRDANLVLDLEFRFAKLRDGIRDGDSVGSVEATAVTV